LAVAERCGLESTLDEPQEVSLRESKGTMRRGHLALFTMERWLSTVFIGLLSGCGLFLT
jgi:hypothetical protein